MPNTFEIIKRIPLTRRQVLKGFAAAAARLLTYSAVRGQEPVPTPISDPADSVPPDMKIMLPIVERKDLTPEQRRWQTFKELMQQITGGDFFSGNPRFTFVENDQELVEGKDEFIGVANDFLAIATNLINHWNDITKQHNVSGYDQGYFRTPVIQFWFSTSDASQGGILSNPDVSGTLRVDVQKGSILSVARAIAELMVPRAAMYSDFDNSEAVRQVQVRLLTLELANRYYDHFINEAHPYVLLFYREDGSAYLPTKEEYLAEFQREKDKWQNPSSSFSPIPTRYILVNGVRHPDFGDDALSTTDKGTSPLAEIITNNYAVKAWKVYSDARNEWIAQGKQTGDQDFWIMSQLGFMQGEDEFGLLRNFTNALGTSDFLRFLRGKFFEAGFILSKQEFAQQAEEIKYSPETMPQVTNFYPTGDIGSREGMIVFSTIQSSIMKDGNIYSALNSFEGVVNQQHPIVEARYNVVSPRTSANLWVRIPPLTPNKIGEGIHQYVFPRRFSVIESDGKVTEFDLNGQTITVEVLMTQAEQNENGDRRSELYTTYPTFVSGNSSGSGDAPVAPDPNAVTVDIIPFADSQ